MGFQTFGRSYYQYHPWRNGRKLYMYFIVHISYSTEIIIVYSKTVCSLSQTKSDNGLINSTSQCSSLNE